jgi:hypothetical protein
MLADELDALDPVAFEQMLADDWAVARKDICEGGGRLVVAAALPMRPPEVMNGEAGSRSTGREWGGEAGRLHAGSAHRSQTFSDRLWRIFE